MDGGNVAHELYAVFTGVCVMAIATPGTMTGNVMNHVATLNNLSIGAVGTAAAINKFVILGRFISRTTLGPSSNECIFACRNAETGGFIYLGLVNYSGGVRLRFTGADGLSGTSNHYTRSTGFEEDGETDLYPPIVAKDQLWFFALVLDASEVANGRFPDTVDLWCYSPASGGANYAIKKITMGHSVLEDNTFPALSNPLTFGGWGGTVVDPDNSSKAHNCEFQDLCFYGDFINDPAFFAAITTDGHSPAEILPNLPTATYFHWSGNEGASPWLETFGSGNNLAAVGTATNVANFTGVNQFPMLPTLDHDSRIAGAAANQNTDFSTATTTLCGATSATTFNRLLERWTFPYTIPADATFSAALCSLKHTVTSGAANAGQPVVLRPILRTWIESTGSAGGVTYVQYDDFNDLGWQVAGATGALDAGSTTYAAGNLPTATGVWTIATQGLCDYAQANLVGASAASYMLYRSTENTPSAMVTVHSKTGTAGSTPVLQLGWSIPFTLANVPVESGSEGPRAARGRRRGRNGLRFRGNFAVR